MRSGFRALAAVTLLVGPGNLAAQTVRGRVTTESDGQAIRFAGVRLLDSSERSAASVLSDSLGFYVVSAPRPGEYWVQVDQLGYERLRSPLLRLEGGHTVTVDFELPTDPIEIEGLRVEAEGQARIRRDLRMFGVRAETLGRRFVDLAAIERRTEARDFGRVLQWQSIPGMTIQRSDDVSPPALRPFICVRLRVRGPCALNVLNGALISLETGYEVPSESLGAIVLLTPQEATLLYGTDGAGGAVLLFTRDFGRDD
jgi:Carboxypeptidase regulatory-like domain